MIHTQDNTQAKNEKKLKIEKHRHGLYYVIPSEIMDTDLLLPNEKLLYALLSGLADHEGKCFPSDEYLAKRLKVHYKTIGDYLKHLEDLNLIKRHTKRIYGKKPERTIQIITNNNKNLITIGASETDNDIRPETDNDVRPEAESITILESEDKRESEEKKQSPPSKKLIEREKEVKTSEEEHLKLEKEMGKEARDECYLILSEWKLITPKHKWKKGDYLSILRWVYDKYKENMQKGKYLNPVTKNSKFAEKISYKYLYELNKRKVKLSILPNNVEFVNLKDINQKIEIFYSSENFKEKFKDFFRKLGIYNIEA